MQLCLEFSYFQSQTLKQVQLEALLASSCSQFGKGFTVGKLKSNLENEHKCKGFTVTYISCMSKIKFKMEHF